MRDNFSFNMLPIVQDNMNCIAGVRGLTNLSSNGYYGYQPPLLLDRQKEEVTPSEAHVPAVQPCSMEVQFESLPQNQNAHRKRSWEFNNYFREFKKRRQNEKISDNTKKKIEEDLFEELLKETHGCSVYHWISDGL